MVRKKECFFFPLKSETRFRREFLYLNDRDDIHIIANGKRKQWLRNATQSLSAVRAARAEERISRGPLSIEWAVRPREPSSLIDNRTRDTRLAIFGGTTTTTSRRLVASSRLKGSTTTCFFTDDGPRLRAITMHGIRNVRLCEQCFSMRGMPRWSPVTATFNSQRDFQTYKIFLEF